MTIRDSFPFRSRARLAAEYEGMRGSLADQLGDIVSTHDPDGTYRYVSAAARDILGLEPADLVGRRPFDLVHSDDQGKLGIVYRGVLEGTPSLLAYRVRRKDNDYVWVETAFRAVRHDETGDVIEVVCSTRPVSERTVTERLSSAEYRQAVERVQDVIEKERIEIVYQPLLDLETEEVIAYEALSRFPGNGARGPDRWFAEAWDIGLGVPLEMLAVRLAARALPHFPDGVLLSVNASPPTIFNEGFIDCLGDHADRVKVELTEHLHVEDYDRFSVKLGRLRQAGVEVAIDDFGAGYASLRHILKLRPEWIKLDISLTEKVSENPIAHALASSLVSFSEEVGVEVIAEGIETEEELDALTEIGFRYGQGFYFGTPAPLDEALATHSLS
jgi:PAS domain S-box-containing protein